MSILAIQLCDYLLMKLAMYPFIKISNIYRSLKELCTNASLLFFSLFTDVCGLCCFLCLTFTFTVSCFPCLFTS